jgi:C1q domain
MTEKYSFFGSAEGDIRQYDQTDYAEVYKRFLKTGVFPSVENELAVAQTVPSRLAIQVNTGQAYIEGYWYGNSAINEIDLPAADAVNPRIDRIVLRLDVVNERKITAEYLQGTAAVAPVAPELTRTDQIYEISLAQVRVNAGATSILNANITDERSNVSLCGWAIPHVTTDLIGAIGHVVKDISNTDLNNLNKTDFYVGSNLGNAPTTFGYFVFHLESPFGKRQFLYKLSTNEVYHRIFTGSAWSPFLTDISSAGGTFNGPIDMNGNDINNVNFLMIGNENSRPDNLRYKIVRSGSSGDLEIRLYDNDGTTLVRTLLALNSDGILSFPSGTTHVEANLSSVSVSSGVAKILTGFTEAEDIKGNFNPSTGQFTVPVTGSYIFNIEFTHSMSVPHTGGISLERNGSNTVYKSFASTGNSSAVERSKTFYLTAGDVIRLLRTGNATGNIDGINLTISKI